MKDTHANIIAACKSLSLQVDCVSSGPITAKIAIISDYPGETEKDTKLPYTGASGVFLWKTLKTIGIERTDVYATNIIKRVVARNEKVRRVEFEQWKSILDVELGLLTELKYILVLGSHALEGLLHCKGITNWRGSVLPAGNKLALVSYNPAYVIEKDHKTNTVVDGDRQVIFNMDIRKFKRLLNGEYTPVEVETHVARTLDDVRAIFDECRAAREVSLDIEHLNAETACVGFATDTRKGYVLPFYNTERNLWTIEEELWIRNNLSELLKTCKVIGQNISSDLCWLWFKDRIRIYNVTGDTLLAHHALYSTLPHNLGFLCSQYTWQPFYKDDGKDWTTKGDIEEYWKYNAKDTTQTLYIHRLLVSALERAGLSDLYNNHILRVLPHLCRATIVGIEIDRRRKAVLDRYYTAQFNKKRRDIIDFAKFSHTHRVGEELVDFNPSSPSQVAELLYTVYKCPVVKGDSTDIHTLNKLESLNTVDNDAKEFISKLKTFRKDQKFLSTYVRTPIDDDGKFRAHYYQFGTTTAPGRLSSGGNQWGTASNIQNQPVLSRQMFVCPKGWSFVYIDLSKAEARYVGWDANIGSWKDEFERERAGEDFDCHRSLAARVFNTPYEMVPTKDYNADGSPTIRYLGKRARHGLNYRMMPFTFAERVGIPISLAETVYNSYHKDAPEIQRWWKALEKEVRDSKSSTGIGTLYNVVGRRLAILGPLDDKSLKSIVAFKPQSSIGDWLLRAWYLCHEDKDWPATALIVLNVHDSLTAICIDDDVRTVARILVKYASDPMVIKGEELIIPSDCKVSVADRKGIKRWSTLKTYTV